MASFGGQLKTLLWRSILLKKRNKKQLIQELFFPIYFVAIIVMVKALAKPKTQPPIDNFQVYNVNNENFGMDTNKSFLVSPDTPETRAIMGGVQNYTGNFNSSYYSTATEVEQAYLANPQDVAAGIIFYSTGANPSYAIRLPYEKTASTSIQFTRQGECRNTNNGSNSFNCQANQYLTSGFLWLQQALEAALINQSIQYPNMSVQMMPKGEFTSDLTAIQSISSVYFIMAFSFFVNFLCTNLVAEKEKKIREGMKMMGLRDSVFWLSWGITYALLILAVNAVITIIMYVAGFYNREHSNVFIFFLLMMLYGLSIITLSFMITPFFKKAQTAGGLTSFATIAISCLYFAVSMTREIRPDGYHYSIPPVGIWFMCLLSPVALALGIDQGIYLDNNRGMNFDNITKGEFPQYAPIIMLTVDIFLYALLAYYLDHVVPGEYGPRYSPLYCFKASYYKQKKVSNSERASLVRNSPNSINSSSQGSHPDIEPVSSDMKNKAGLRIFNISKNFKNKKETVRAVQGISLDVYEGQITALLGHNGAGKTTLINMLCGLSPPTSGCATIYDMDVSNSGDMERIRKMCGVCPQHNILYDELTTMEHLKVFAGIKGVPEDKQETQIKQAMKDADIFDKADTFAKNLSGGQKRKLSVAMALIGNPKIIFLDEPTAGMDPYSRRHLWSLLQKTKKDRIILLSTHFMDEADILADRKAIINHGKLRCCGSSLFLKNRFGIGYHLDMVVEPNSDSSRITDTLSKHVQGVEMKRSHAKELSFTMPLAEVSNFSYMFNSLEEKNNGQTIAESLGIKSYGVSMTTLEEVFLKLGEEEEAIELNNGSFSNPTFSPLETSGSQVNIDMKPEIKSLRDTSHNVKDQNLNLGRQRFWALLKMRFLLHRRNPYSVIFGIILPIVFVIIACVLNKTGSKTSDQSNPVQLSLRKAGFMYAASQQVPKSPPLVVIDSQGNAQSSQFVSEVNKTWRIDQVNNSVNLRHLSTQHFAGFNLQQYDTTNHGISYTALYNDSAVHSLPSIVNLISSTLLAILTNNQSAFIDGNSLPWPSSTKKLTYNSSAFTTALLLGLAFVVAAPTFATHIVQDRQMKVRSQLRVAGVTFNLYWGTIFVINLLEVLLPVIICIIIVAAVQIESLNNAGALLSIILLFLTYLPCMIILAYIFSFAFDKFETCQAILPNFFTFTALLPYIGVSMCDMFGLTNAAKIIHNVLVVICPPYALTGGLYFIDRVYRVAVIFDDFDLPASKYFEPDSNILICIIMPLVHMILLYILLRVLDVRNTGGKAIEAVKFWNQSKVEDIPEDNSDIIEEEDEDVKEERNRVASLERNMDGNTVGYIQNLRKEFQTDKTSCFKNNAKKEKVKVAVRNATFAVDRGEVLGLLGPNGAGKTTTLNMIIAETGPTRGKVMVGGFNVRSSMSKAFQAMGYCPQHDALWDLITMREHLEFYALMHGLTPENSVLVSDSLIEGLKVEEHANKKAKKLSGGTKRKLSYALSMLGSPQFVLMDEPSTGMDPQSKRFLWDTISSSFEGSDRGAILTTHYMEEADALCSRVGIMVNGQLECLGPTQHLKDKFGSGYLLEIKLKQVATHSHDTEQRMDSLERHLVSLFPHATCMERFEERGQYKIPKQDVISLADTFSSLEQTKHSHDVEEYSFSQSTLEQVFLDFAKKQHEEGSDIDHANKEKKLERQLSGGDVNVQM